MIKTLVDFFAETREAAKNKDFAALEKAAQKAEEAMKRAQGGKTSPTRLGLGKT